MIGKTFLNAVGITLLYENHDIGRFPRASRNAALPARDLPLGAATIWDISIERAF
jgi:hypothetical protein